MRYPQEHWEKVAKFYNEATVHPTELTGGKNVETVKIAKVQNHFPEATESTVARWIRRCRKDGLL
jgi:transposase